MRKFGLFFLFVSYMFFWGCSCSSRSKTYSIGIDSAWTASNFGNMKANIFGFTNNFLIDLSKETHLSFEKVLFNERMLFQGLEEEKYDAILTTLMPYNFNRDKYQFSETFLETGPVLVVGENDDVSSLGEFSNKVIAIQQSDLPFLNLSSYTKNTFQIYESVASALLELKKGNVDGAIVQRLDALNFLDDNYYEQLKIVGDPLTDQGIRFVVKKGHMQSLMKVLDQTLSRMKKKSSYKTLMKKWDLTTSPTN